MIFYSPLNKDTLTQQFIPYIAEKLIDCRQRGLTVDFIEALPELKDELGDRKFSYRKEDLDDVIEDVRVDKSE